VTIWELQLHGLPGIGLVQAGDDLGDLIVDAAAADDFPLGATDVVVVASKIVSKAEGRLVDLADVVPTERAQRLAERTGRDPRVCQLYIDESRAILNVKGRHVVTIDRRGFVGTGAGVDMSNVALRSKGIAVLLPVDGDASARRIRDRIAHRCGVRPAVIVSDSFGSAERDGAYGAAIGIAGIRHLEEPDGEHDLYHNPSRPLMNRVDEVASAASILMGQTDAARPVIICRGVPYTIDEDASISRLLITPPVSDIDFDLRPEF
jgi:coenzyme F420-0:L-glutamate ligase/coenzyme F420-1:gamma-L-glutamate ligase